MRDLKFLTPARPRPPAPTAPHPDGMRLRRGEWETKAADLEHTSTGAGGRGRLLLSILHFLVTKNFAKFTHFDAAVVTYWTID